MTADEGVGLLEVLVWWTTNGNTPKILLLMRVEDSLVGLVITTDCIKITLNIDFEAHCEGSRCHFGTN